MLTGHPNCGILARTTTRDLFSMCTKMQRTFGDFIAIFAQKNNEISVVFVDPENSFKKSYDFFAKIVRFLKNSDFFCFDKFLRSKIAEGSNLQAICFRCGFGLFFFKRNGLK